MKTRNLFNIFIILACLCTSVACDRKDYIISDKHKDDVPKRVRLLEYTDQSLTICWDMIQNASSYTVQLVDRDMNPTDEKFSATVTDIDYYEFTELSQSRGWYARVRANYTWSATSDWVYVTGENGPSLLFAGKGAVDVRPQIKEINTSSSTATIEWAFTDDLASDAAMHYDISIFRDSQCKDLVVSWDADGKLSSNKGLFTPIANMPSCRFTFSGLEPETDYYARVTNLSLGNMHTDLLRLRTSEAAPSAVSSSASSGDIILSQDFSNFIHGGDVVYTAAGYNAKSGSKFRKEWEVATGENPVADGDRPLCAWNVEFHIHTGGTTSDYIDKIGMTGWGSSGNISTRPGYIKCGGGNGGQATLYTPEFKNISSESKVQISFRACAYTEGDNIYGSNVIVSVVDGSVFGSNNVVKNKGVTVSSTKTDISGAVGKFDTFTATLDKLSPGSRIAFSSDPDMAKKNKTRFLLDDIVVKLI